MAYTKAGQKAVDKYISKAYDQFSIRFKKGEREKYKEHAESKGKSLNALIIELLEADTLELSAAVPTAPEREECENLQKVIEKYVDKYSDYDFKCSVCNIDIAIDDFGEDETFKINFCPKCGRKIKQ